MGQGSGRDRRPCGARALLRDPGVRNGRGADQAIDIVYCDEDEADPLNFGLDGLVLPPPGTCATCPFLVMVFA
jgi:hypothetical protein